MPRTRLLASSLAILSGVALAGVLVAFALARLAAHPSVPGTQPRADFVTLVPVGIGSEFSDGGHISYDSLAHWFPAPSQAVTAIATQRQVVRGDGSGERVAMGFFGGPLFEGLGVEVEGHIPAQPSLEASLAGPRPAQPELLVRRSLALRWFGSTRAALGQRVEIDTLVAPMTGERVTFAIAGVFDDDFAGPSAATQADVWIPLSTWPEMMMPAQQRQLMRSLPTEFIGALTGDGVVAMQSRLHAAMQASGSARDLRLLAMPGLGLEGSTRLVYARWARTLQLFAGGLGAMLLAFAFAMRWLDLANRESEDRTRAALGERASHWWRRNLRISAQQVAGTLVSTATALLFVHFASGSAGEGPLATAIDGIAGAPISWFVVGVFVLLLALAPLAAQRLQRRLGQGGAYAHPPLAVARMLIVLAISAVAALAAASALGVLQLEHLRERDLGFDAKRLSITERSSALSDSALSRMTDGRAATPLLADLAQLGIAAANAGPVQHPSLIQGSLARDGGTGEVQLLTVNFVSANYFDVIGLRAESHCGAFAAFAPTQAIANRAFLRKFDLHPGQPMPTLTLSLPGGESAITLCGSVADGQFDDVRADPRPTLYMPLQRLGDLGVLIASTRSSGNGGDALASVLDRHAHDIEWQPWQTLTARIETQLQDERMLSQSGLLALTLALALGIAVCAATVMTAAAMHARQLAIRAALGASRRRLLLHLFVPSSTTTQGIFAAVAAGSAWLALRQLDASGSDAWLSLAGAAAAAMTAVLAAMIFVARAVREERLRDWLADRQ
ncbi:MAG: ABC transporter permease [Xanthomonadales bacterium]|nr:ABC transporter permease [Xanthomonadales bacterium]MCC6561837.1 ABC transporter permease [Xanthomonadales bacterium]